MMPIAEAAVEAASTPEVVEMKAKASAEPEAEETIVSDAEVVEPSAPEKEARVKEIEDNNATQTETVEVDTAPETATTAAAEQRKAKGVRFDVADVVEFEPTMWTATVASEGVPVGMSVSVRRRTKRPLDSYESERSSQRVNRQEYMEFGYLEPDERLDILENAGHSISIISHVERESLRINRERWESNEYDLMYQYGLGEVPLMEDSDLEMMPQQELMQEDNDLMHVDYSSEDDLFFGGGSSRNMLVDAEVRFAMEEMDAYDVIHPRSYDELSVDYASDCILGDDESSDGTNELPYAVDSFDSSLSFDLLDMSSSPSDVSGSSDILAASTCAKSAAIVSSSTDSESSSAPVVAMDAVPTVVAI